MTLIAPKWDADFAASDLHGVPGQITRMKAAVAYCKDLRTAIDVGAHIGIWTTFLANKFKRVDAFEPVPENMHCLETNTKELNNVVLWPVALGFASGVVSMDKHGENSGCWRVRGGTDVQMSRLDDFNFSGVDLLKIDAEGYEGYVLLGAEKTLDESRPVVVFEENGLGKKFYGSEWVDPTTVLRKHGYRMRVRYNKDFVWSP